MQIRAYLAADEVSVISLWQRCNLTRPQNNPRLDIQRKLKVNPELFLVGTVDGRIVATVMGGYEGHRGWINYLSVDPDFQRKGLGRRLMRAIELKLRALGCPKINLQVRSDNSDALSFYEKIGYEKDNVISMGIRLIQD
jgi:ribosomal protein S18 acetylase RimI-like enzyme